MYFQQLHERKRFLKKTYFNIYMRYALACFIFLFLYSQTLKQIGSVLINKLKLADVGNRPVIWVCHSMGGREIIHVSNM